jgi:hypothetical protein
MSNQRKRVIARPRDTAWGCAAADGFLRSRQGTRARSTQHNCQPLRRVDAGNPSDTGALTDYRPAIFPESSARGGNMPAPS